MSTNTLLYILVFTELGQQLFNYHETELNRDINLLIITEVTTMFIMIS